MINDDDTAPTVTSISNDFVRSVVCEVNTVATKNAILKKDTDIVVKTE
jgi:hypothetical protein